MYNYLIDKKFPTLGILNLLQLAMRCIECDNSIHKSVYNYSTDNFGVALCVKCQNWARDMVDSRRTTEEVLNLYLLLREYGINAELEKHDGYKTIDIVIEEAKVHIEVDGVHHNYNSRQALSDLRRTYYSFRNGYFTLRLPNSLVRNNLEEAAECIVELLELGKSRVPKKRWRVFKLLS